MIWSLSSVGSEEAAEIEYRARWDSIPTSPMASGNEFWPVSPAALKAVLDGRPAGPSTPEKFWAEINTAAGIDDLFRTCIADTRAFELKPMLKERLRLKTCLDWHPGLCARDVGRGQLLEIKRIHKNLRVCIKRMFPGHLRKRTHKLMMMLVGTELDASLSARFGVSGQARLVFCLSRSDELSDQFVFTSYATDAPPDAPLPIQVHVDTNEAGSLVERTGHQLVFDMCTSGYKYWAVSKIEMDTCTEISRISSSSPLQCDELAPEMAAGAAKDDLDTAFDELLSPAVQPKGAEAATRATDAADAAFEKLFGMESPDLDHADEWSNSSAEVALEACSADADARRGGVDVGDVEPGLDVAEAHLVEDLSEEVSAPHIPADEVAAAEVPEAAGLDAGAASSSSALAMPEASAASAAAVTPAILAATGRFGVFTFIRTWRSAHGGFEVSCPFHKKNLKSGCRRHFRVDGPTEEDLERAVKLAMWWCVKAKDHARQARHLTTELPESECPPFDALYALKETEMPTGVMSDVELNRLGIAE